MWFKVDDTFHSHPKRHRAARAGLAAIGMWTVVGSYCMSYKTDGFIADWYVASLPDGLALAETLVAADLWSPAEKDGETGWQFHDWDDYQPSSSEIEKTRENSRARQRRHRSKLQGGAAEKGAVTAPVTPPVTRDSHVSHPVSYGSPSRPDPSINTWPPDGAETDPDPLPADNDQTDSELVDLTTASSEAASNGGRRNPRQHTEPARFAEFWAAYPRKVKKPLAMAAWARASKTTDPQVILDALPAHLAEWAGRDIKHIPHPTSWLNARSWEDELKPTGATRNPWAHVPEMTREEVQAYKAAQAVAEAERAARKAARAEAGAQ